ncbi:MAG: DUF4129 domain-containing protein [Acidimicrobiales bacterium]
MLAVLLLVLGALAGALSDTTRGTATVRAGASSVVLSVTLTLGGLMVLFAAAAIVYALFTSAAVPRSGESDTRRRWWKGPVALLTIGGLVVVVVLLLSHRRRGRQPTQAIGTSPFAHPSVAHHSAVHFLPSASAATVGIVALVAAALLIASWVGSRRLGTRWNLGEILRTRTPPPSAISSPASLARSLAQVRIADPDEEADPRRAVVAAYLAMTRAAGAGAGADAGAAGAGADAGAAGAGAGAAGAGAGAAGAGADAAAAGAGAGGARAGGGEGTGGVGARRSSETASEFLQRLLASLGSSRDAAARLTSLFEAARYSSHSFDDTLRLDAITALRRVQLDLAAAQGSPSTVDDPLPAALGFPR